MLFEPIFLTLYTLKPPWEYNKISRSALNSKFKCLSWQIPYLGLVVPRAKVDKVVGAHRAVELVAGDRQPVLVRHRRLLRPVVQREEDRLRGEHPALLIVTYIN